MRRTRALVLAPIVLWLSHAGPSVANAGFTLTTIANFNGTNGAQPQAGVTRDAQGNLYGTTELGGATDRGTIFRIAAGTGALTTIAAFDGANGDLPLAGVTLDARGNLYGTTDQGGANNLGTVFRIDAGSGALTTITTFDGTNGALPQGVIVDAQGNLYGTTSLSGSIAGGMLNGSGTVFEIAVGTGAFTTIATFDGTNGSYPIGVTLDSQGNLYGTTSANGGANGRGTVFELVNNSTTVPEPASFIAVGQAAVIGIALVSRVRSRRARVRAGDR